MEEINELLSEWNRQGIITTPNSLEKIKDVLSEKYFLLPNDFIELYQQVNGMEELYPNYNDEKGFLFYPIEALTTLNKVYDKCYGVRKRKQQKKFERIIVFADFLNECWRYGVNAIDTDTYSIGIIANYGQFKTIANSLEEFIKLYLEDSEILYDFE